MQTLGNYQIMIASKYFESIEDFINLEIAVKRFEGNMERFHYNPIPLDCLTRFSFPNLETLHLYDSFDEKFDDGRIFKQCIWHEVSYDRYLLEKDKGNECKLIYYSRADRETGGKQIPNNVKILGNSCFCGCSCSKGIEIPESIISIDNYCFCYCKIKNINIPSSVTSIGRYCFQGCQFLQSISIPNSVSVIQNCCFSCCTSLTNIVFSNSLKQLEYSSFEECHLLKTVELTHSITRIGDNCFLNCKSLRSIKLSSSLRSIGKKCFSGCTSLESLSTPQSLKTIPSLCFENCYSLQTIIALSPLNFDEDCFFGCSNIFVKDLSEKITQQ